MYEISKTLDSHTLASAFKHAKKAVNIKHSNSIKKGLTLKDNETVI